MWLKIIIGACILGAIIGLIASGGRQPISSALNGCMSGGCMAGSCLLRLALLGFVILGILFLFDLVFF